MIGGIKYRRMGNRFSSRCAIITIEVEYYDSVD